MVKIRVPATSANLGPGFDCLGIALALYNTYTVEASEELILEGVEERFNNEDNIIVQSFRKAGGNNLKVSFDTQIPISRGLGSSAALYTAGVCAYSLLNPGKYTKDELFDMIAELEGHPDNAAPCLYGGLTGCLKKEDNSYQTAFLNVSDDYLFTAFVPEIEVSTELARSILPADYSRAVASNNSAHAVLMVHALETGNLSLLKDAAIDQFHEPYRKLLIPGYDRLKQITESDQDGVLLISGSGSTCLFISKTPVSDRALAEIHELPGNWKEYPLKVAYNGTEVEENGVWHPII